MSTSFVGRSWGKRCSKQGRGRKKKRTDTGNVANDVDTVTTGKVVESLRRSVAGNGVVILTFRFFFIFVVSRPSSSLHCRRGVIVGYEASDLKQERDE